MANLLQLLREGNRKNKKKGDDKISTIIKEFERGTLKSGSGKKVTKKSQALAIALEEARKRNSEN